MLMCYPASYSCPYSSSNQPPVEPTQPRKAILRKNLSPDANPGRTGHRRHGIVAVICNARGRRSARHGYEEEEDDEEEYGYNEDIGELEEYTRSVRGEALIVHSVVDGNDVELVIYKGFSSSLSHMTWADPSKSVLPARAEVKRIDRIRGPFNPSDVFYIERDVPWDTFRARIRGLPG
ncbi:hypothetical protein MLD38_004438 [Melastoma candidum]|uniref:Uncharacterized protein n=1 Tax=Melastoma candidum TaxID=119954 RepID=A0ACB9S6I0_9MYRT|nr:hypothetical protein MLD38_004438 [Melastoma candidum]